MVKLITGSNLRRRTSREISGLVKMVKCLVKQQDVPQESCTDIRNHAASMLERTLDPAAGDSLDPRDLFRRIVQEHRDIDWSLFLGQRTTEQQKADIDDDIPLD